MKKYFRRYVLSGRTSDRVQVKVFALVVFLQPAKNEMKSKWEAFLHKSKPVNVFSLRVMKLVFTFLVT